MQEKTKHGESENMYMLAVVTELKSLFGKKNVLIIIIIMCSMVNSLDDLNVMNGLISYM